MRLLGNCRVILLLNQPGTAVPTTVLHIALQFQVKVLALKRVSSQLHDMGDFLINSKDDLPWQGIGDGITTIISALVGPIATTGWAKGWGGSEGEMGHPWTDPCGV